MGNIVACVMVGAAAVLVQKGCTSGERRICELKYKNPEDQQWCRTQLENERETAANWHPHH